MLLTPRFPRGATPLHLCFTPLRSLWAIVLQRIFSNELEIDRDSRNDGSEEKEVEMKGKELRWFMKNIAVTRWKRPAVVLEKFFFAHG